MSIRLLLLSLFIVFFSNPVQAKDFKGTVSASIVDPTTMDMQTALEWCKENPYSLKCELIFESVALDDDESSFDEMLEKDEIFYEVLTTTIE